MALDWLNPLIPQQKKVVSNDRTRFGSRNCFLECSLKDADQARAHVLLLLRCSLRAFVVLFVGLAVGGIRCALQVGMLSCVSDSGVDVVVGSVIVSKMF